jgi:cbb3-type cytochrome oxidase subunit 3
MAWELLLTSDIGLLSLFTILFILVMAAYLYRFARRHMAEDEQKAGLGREG